MIGILLGAGASFGSEAQNAPPLGKDLYLEIKDINIGPRISGHETTQIISIHEWIFKVAPSAIQKFMGGDFESGMGIIDDTLKIQTKKSAVKLDVMSPTNEFGDVSLLEKIMREVAVTLYKYLPSDDNLYFDLIKFLPEGSHVYTLNYDQLFEAACVSQKVNLIENHLIQKQCLTHPEKSFRFHQLHGGVSLHVYWPPTRYGIAGLQVNTDKIQRISVRAHISHGVHFNLPVEEYGNHYKTNTVMAFYNRDKYIANAPKLLKEIQSEYKGSLESEVNCLIVIGCRYLEHDKHIWDAVRNFEGQTFWCGSQMNLSEHIKNFTHIGNRYAEAQAEINDIVKKFS